MLINEKKFGIWHSLFWVKDREWHGIMERRPRTRYKYIQSWTMVFCHLVERNCIHSTWNTSISCAWFGWIFYTYSMSCFVQRLSPFHLDICTYIRTQRSLCTTKNVCPGLYDNRIKNLYFKNSKICGNILNLKFHISAAHQHFNTSHYFYRNKTLNNDYMFTCGIFCFNAENTSPSQMSLLKTNNSTL